MTVVGLNMLIHFVKICCVSIFGEYDLNLQYNFFCRFQFCESNQSFLFSS
jgi:hypothetical protein